MASSSRSRPGTSRRVPPENPPVGLGGKRHQLREQLLAGLVHDCDEAIGLVRKELVERVARGSRRGHHRGTVAANPGSGSDRIR